MVQSSYKLIFLIINIFFLVGSVAHYGNDIKCGHGKENYTPEILDIEEDTSSITEGRGLASTYRNLRIYGFYDYLVQSAPTEFAAYVQNELAPPVISYLQAALKVKYPVVGNLTLPSTIKTVCGKTTPAILKSKGVAADYLIMYDAFDDDSTTIASSLYCYQASGTKRPLIAKTSFNTNVFLLPKGDILFHEKNMYVLIHEMMHTLGFSDNAFDDFIDEKGNPRTGHIKSVMISGTARTVIDVPPLTDRLRKFYGCPTIPGGIMENDGGSGTRGSHFERKFFVYETMSSGGILSRRVSEFSLALLEGSGWYVPDYSYAEPFFFGQGQGCDFVFDKCSTISSAFDEFCIGSGRGCAPQGRAGGNCDSDSKADGCSYVDPDEDYDCENPDAVNNARLPTLQTYGRDANSKCFTGDLNTKSSTSLTTFCFKYNCTGSGSSTQLQIFVGSNTLICKQEGKLTVKGYYGAVNCPDPLTFCNTVGKKYCPRNCMGRGTCVNYKCQCNSGFKGIDCGLRTNSKI